MADLRGKVQILQSAEKSYESEKLQLQQRVKLLEKNVSDAQLISSQGDASSGTSLYMCDFLSMLYSIHYKHAQLTKELNNHLHTEKGVPKVI